MYKNSLKKQSEWNQRPLNAVKSENSPAVKSLKFGALDKSMSSDNSFFDQQKVGNYMDKGPLDQVSETS